MAPRLLSERRTPGQATRSCDPRCTQLPASSRPLQRSGRSCSRRCARWPRRSARTRAASSARCASRRPAPPSSWSADGPATPTSEATSGRSTSAFSAGPPAFSALPPRWGFSLPTRRPSHPCRFPPDPMDIMPRSRSLPTERGAPKASRSCSRGEQIFTTRARSPCPEPRTLPRTRRSQRVSRARRDGPVHPVRGRPLAPAGRGRRRQPESIAEALQSEALRVHPLATAAEALKVLDGPRCPSLILLDLSTPGLGGRERPHRRGAPAGSRPFPDHPDVDRPRGRGAGDQTVRRPGAPQAVRSREAARCPPETRLRPRHPVARGIAWPPTMPGSRKTGPVTPSDPAPRAGSAFAQTTAVAPESPSLPPPIHAVAYYVTAEPEKREELLRSSAPSQPRSERTPDAWSAPCASRRAAASSW